MFGACNQNRGTRLFKHYSAKKFEGVKDVRDAQQLRGRFVGQSEQAQPAERSFFEVALCKLNPNVGQQMPKGILTIKVEYIVQLLEPTESNEVQEPAAPAGAGTGGSYPVKVYQGNMLL